MPTGGAALPFVYLRGTLSSTESERLQGGSTFEELWKSGAFGSGPLAATLYLSSAKLQTNLHVDEHSGFLVQVCGHKRVVMFRSAKSLRCDSWNDATDSFERVAGLSAPLTVENRVRERLFTRPSSCAFIH